MSPEQCNGRDLTPAADVYSLGVILYEMLTGMVPFSGTTPLAIALKHASDPPQKPREIVSSIPPDLESLVLQALAKRPEDRPADAATFRSQLLATAERLGLEHASVTSGPDLASLRNAGVESPSGRLIVDISRLRESKAISSGTNELTVIGAGSGDKLDHRGRPAADKVPPEKHVFPRLEVELGRSIFQRGRVVLATGILVGLLLAAFVFFATRSGPAPAPAIPNTIANASPSPTVTPSPTPAPSVPVKHQATPNPDNANKKKQSKVGALVDKVKHFIKKPF